MKLISTLILTFLLSGCFIFGDPVEFDETTGQTPQWILSRGEAYASNSDWPSAIKVLEKGEQRYPNSRLAPQFKLDLALKSSTVALMQYLGMPFGPSGKTCPKCISEVTDLISVLLIP